MKLLGLGIAFLLTACSQQQAQFGEPSSWVSTERVRPMAEEYIAKRGFRDARMVEELGQGRFFRYRFATGDVVVAESVVVDRKTGKVTSEQISH